MKKQTNKLAVVVILIVLAMLTIGGCKKTETKTKTQLLTTGTWKVTAWTSSPPQDFDGNGTTETDGYATLGSETKDNFLSFKTDGSVIQDEGATKPTSSDPQTKSGTWAFGSSESKVTITGDLIFSVGSVEYPITTLDENTLVFTIGAGTTSDPTVTFTFKH